MDRIALILTAVVVTGCTSPEAERTRGGTRGADIGNRGDEVLMHEGSRPYFRTPTLQPTDPPPLDGAAHAHALSVDR